jgi:hypothetical protein
MRSSGISRLLHVRRQRANRFCLKKTALTEPKLGETDNFLNSFAPLLGVERNP